MSENVSVVVRVRAANEKEEDNDEKCLWTIDEASPNIISISPSSLCDLVSEGKLSPASCIKFHFGIKKLIKY